MRWSFRTNGNYVDFVHTDETSEAVESVIFHLHNTSRCVSWSLPSDTTRINFTIDEVKYSNILITDIDFDGTAMNSQDDFETGITGMFTGLSGSPGGDSGLALESYQNSAMSAAVMAYVFRDEDDNIFRVYEPIRNNDVSRKSYAYADSIDKFAFDSTDNFNNRLLDVKLVTVPAATKFQGCTLETMIINVTNKTGIEFLNHFQKGSYGIDIAGNGGHGEEVYITGNNVVFDGNYAWHGRSTGAPTYFDNLGADSYIKGSQFGVSSIIKGNSFLTKLTDCDLKSFGTIDVIEDMVSGQCLDVVMEDGAYLTLTSIGGTVNAVHLGVVASLNITSSAVVSKLQIGNSGDITLGHNHSECSFGVAASYVSAGNKSNQNFIRIGSTTYQMGEDTGAMTLTAV